MRAVQDGVLDADGIVMEADEVLDRLRAAVIVVDALGTVKQGYGGFGGFLGYEVADLVGTSVFAHVAPDDVDDLAIYFLENAGQSLDVVALPLPFRVSLVAADGMKHPVDVVPTAVEQGDDGMTWVVLLVPIDLQTAVSRSLELEMSGAPRHDVKEMLTEELAVENENYSTRWFLVDLDDSASPAVISARPDSRAMAELLTNEISERRWQPWGDLRSGETSMIACDDLPEPLRAHAAAQDWRRVTVTPVHLEGSIVAAYVLFGRVPANYDLGVVNLNVAGRIRSLVNVTALLIARWRESDRLVTAATHDSLTGLANRDAFFDACTRVGGPAVVLYVDIDRFKPINDGFGHDVGDSVLKEVAQRITLACGPNAVVARFGGDEFVVLLDAIDIAEAHEIGERIIATVAKPMVAGEFEGRVHVSVGLATMTDQPATDVVDAADRAMLQAKRTGRARLVASAPAQTHGS